MSYLIWLFVIFTVSSFIGSYLSHVIYNKYQSYKGLKVLKTRMKVHEYPQFLSEGVISNDNK